MEHCGQFKRRTCEGFSLRFPILQTSLKRARQSGQSATQYADIAGDSLNQGRGNGGTSLTGVQHGGERERTQSWHPRPPAPPKVGARRELRSGRRAGYPNRPCPGVHILRSGTVPSGGTSACLGRHKSPIHATANLELHPSPAGRTTQVSALLHLPSVLLRSL